MQVKNQREYAAVLKEIDAAKATIGEHEVAILSSMDEVETLKADLEARAAQPEMAATAVTKLPIDPRNVRGHFLETATQLRVFFDAGQEAKLDITSGRGTVKTLKSRVVFFEVNSLHLNNLKGAWTYVADAFAIALIILALTGVSMMKGARGFWGRGKYFVAAGLAVPIIGIVYIYSA